MTTVILINFNLEFYFGTQLFVISGVNYLINHKENGKKREKNPWRHAHLQTMNWAENGISNSKSIRRRKKIPRPKMFVVSRGIEWHQKFNVSSKNKET